MKSETALITDHKSIKTDFFYQIYYCLIFLTINYIWKFPDYHFHSVFFPEQDFTDFLPSDIPNLLQMVALPVITMLARSSRISFIKGNIRSW